MGALAILLKEAGYDVRGSDGPLYPPMSTQLERAEVPVFEGFGDSNLEWGPDMIVVGNVCSKDHVEVLAAQARGMELESFPSALAKLLLPGRRALVVAGTHGKTTTSTLVSWLLSASKADPSWLIGGVPENLPAASHLGGGPAIVLEGDEYDTAFFDKASKFLHYQPHRAILTSVEFDHADIFDSIDEVRAAFRAFVELIPEDGELVVHRDDSEAMGIAAHTKAKVSTYRVLPDHDEDTASADYVVKVLRAGSSRRMDFEIYERGQNLGSFSTSMSGRYNLANILAAFAVARSEGVEVEPLRMAIRRFRGVKRRQELLGVAQGVRLLQDFAHHPTAVQLTTRALRRRYPAQSLHVCFEPRSGSSRRAVFFEGYASAFDAASRVYLGPLHAPQKIPADQRLDTYALADAISTRGCPARAFDSVEAVCEAVLAAAVPGDTVLFLTCGAFGGLPQMVLNGLGDAVVFGHREDLPAINQLLIDSGMPSLVDPETVETLAIHDVKGDVVAAVNLQLGESSVYLFGLVVKPSRRGEGLGWVLADSVMRWARTLGAKSVCLIAGSSADYFADRLGFSVVQAAELPEDAKQLSNYTNSARPDSICMIYHLPAES
jgi:UDP-N-acetylmuramate: L-alanyl-gamma-D-glutamyl-meso-diaminopimelate ligase